MTSNGNSNVFTMVKASDLYPRKGDAVKDAPHLTLPFKPLSGEDAEYLGVTREGGVLALTNYRLHAAAVSSSPFINIPVGLIETVEARDLFNLYVHCKDARYFRLHFQDHASCEAWTKRISAAAAKRKAQDAFAFVHYAWAQEEKEVEEYHRRRDHPEFSWFRSEISRLRFDVQGAWRVSRANKDYKLCGTYPEELLIPVCVSDGMLEKIAQFRSARRVPAVLWRHATTGAVLARCSQPEVGWLGWRSTEDEQMVKALADACAFDKSNDRASCIALSSDCGSIDGEDDDDDERSSSSSSTSSSSSDDPINGKSESSLESPKKVLIIDARSYAAAFGNRARGGGVECPEYYPNTEIVFMSLGNIHYIRKSFHALRSLCNAPTDQASWFGALDGTKWLTHLSGLLKAAVRCTTALEVEGRPVIVHCSDGWDRTPQIVSLSELLLDPYYRTLEGFQVLVEKEWLDFGHKMADRCGLAGCDDDPNERSPIFLQWLDCVHQLLLQFPCYFEFNHSYLVKLAQHAYSSLFGTFLCNSQQERRKHGIPEKTRSVWSYLRSHPYKFKNFLYRRKEEALWPKSEVRDLLLWKDVYVYNTEIGGTPPKLESSGDNSAEGSEVETDNLVKEETENHSQINNGIVKNEVEKSLSRNDDDSSSKPIESSTDTLVAAPTETVSSLPPRNCLSESLQSFLNRCDRSEYFQGPLDDDGLVSHNDTVQQRLVEMVTKQRSEVQALKHDLHITRMALCRQQKALKNERKNGGHKEEEDDEEEEEAAIGTAQSGSTASELSWEAVEERETKPTLWVPDHAASACMGCKTGFWFGRRKHHCRNCGWLFCSECSDNLAPIPTEQLYHPVRVCDECYNALTVENGHLEDRDDDDSKDDKQEKVYRNKGEDKSVYGKKQEPVAILNNPDPVVVEQQC